MKILGITILLTLLSTLSSCSLREDGDMEVCIVRKELGYPGYDDLNITQNFNAGSAQDSIVAYLSTESIFNYFRFENTGDYFLAHELEVNVDGQDIDYDFNGFTIKAPIKDGVHVRLNYSHGNCYDIKVANFHAIASSSLVLSGWSSWYFSSSNNPIGKVRFVLPDTATGIFANYPLSQKDTNVFITSSIAFDKPLDFVLLDKNHYDRCCFSSSNYNLSYYCNHSFDVQLDTLENGQIDDFGEFSIINEKSIDSTLISSRFEMAKHIVSRLEDITNNSHKRDIIIIDNLFRRGDYVFGTTLSTDSINRPVYTILLDTTSFNNGVLAHELTHCFLPTVSEADRGKFIFSESLVEFVSIFATCEDSSKMGEIFAEKYSKISKQENPSVFDIETNHINTETGEGTSMIIYDAVPCSMYRMFKKQGAEGFIRFLIKYISYVEMNNGMIMFEDIKDIALSSGVTRESWQEFVDSI